MSRWIMSFTTCSRSSGFKKRFPHSPQLSSTLTKRSAKLISRTPILEIVLGVISYGSKLQTRHLGESRATSQHCLQRILRRLSTDPTYQNLYSSFIRGYEELQHMIRVPLSTPEPSPVFYLPHHGVLQDDNITTKLRVVFNGSSLTSTGSSLNDILHTGANLQPDISDILLWVRRHRYILITDITKMFRQIQVYPVDWDLQRILWVDDQLNIIPYQLTTVTYGTRSAPFLAVRVLLQLVEDEGRNYSLAVHPLLMGRYVDDICGGADTLPELISIAHQLVNLCKVGGIPLAKWQSNHPELFQALPMDGAAVEPHSFANTQGKILELTWQPHSDQFVFQSKASNRPVITKRTILSEVAQLFYPLGFLSTVIIRAKTLLQELWLEKVGWDDCLSPQLRDRWTHFRSELSDLTSITIPRWMSLTPSATVELHGFSDASQLAMAAAVYIKVTPHTTEPIITLVCAKTKVAPLKRFTIPRLELTATVLLSRLISYIQRTLELAEIPIYLDGLISIAHLDQQSSLSLERLCSESSGGNSRTRTSGPLAVYSRQGESSRLCFSRSLFRAILSASSLVEQSLVASTVSSTLAKHDITARFGGDS
ncbi:uncharacterized protein [Polyergus mexicanus]|uniref:uncharacterized protein n=1 Tax=Polyergus mexicanus TaxID=615972 RepID=UPI0038B453D7